MTADPRMSEFMDRVAIRERIDLYIDRLNHRDWDRYAELLTDDFTWTCTEPRKMRVESKQAMMAMVTTVQQYQHGFVFQMGHGVVVDEIVGNRARSRHTLQILADQFMMIGLYYDILVKEADGVWRFQRRDYRITYCEEAPAHGKIFRQLPDPNYVHYPEA
jgi:ketosteroid isomerase-like protein